MKGLMRWLGLVLLALLALQLFFATRIAVMTIINPASTTFERSQAWQLKGARAPRGWEQRWVGYDKISDNLKRAVIASEDSEFLDHNGVDWDAVQSAWRRNAKAEARRKPKIIGGSTITQQLAKNLLLSGERTFWRKGQEYLLTLYLEVFLSKRRILEIYLNHVEWGAGVFGAEAAARHYFGKSAAQLSPLESARLAVMLPRPKFFEKIPASPYVASRSQTILARMPSADLPE